MVKRNNNQLPNNLPQLQNLIKRDPSSYQDEFEQQQRHYESLLSVFQLHPGDFSKGLDELVMFMAQVAHCYPGALANYAQQLITILQKHNTVLDPNMRMAFCRALILLRNKNMLAPTDLLALFFQLLRSHDKALRKFLTTHIVTDIKNTNAKHTNAKLNTTLQNFMYGMLKDSNGKAAKMSLDIMVDLYKKNIWNDTKTVNVIATGCFSKVTKIMVTALKFFLSSSQIEKEEDSDSDDEPSTKDVVMSNKFNKKTRKREKQLKKVKQLVQKNKKKKANAPSFNFSALQLLHDPQGMAERLLQKLQQSSQERFEVKLMILDIVSRLIGLHQLFVLNYYPYIQKYLQPHQKEVTKLLQFVAQASHELVPPDVLQPVLKSLVGNFVSERNTSDVMAIGLNAVRELCARCPLVMSEDLLRDLVAYKNYRDRSVMMAARSLIHLYRTSLPDMLHKRDRGRPTDSSIEIKAKQYGEVDAKHFVAGAEVLLDELKEPEKKLHEESDHSDSDEWIDVNQSDGELEVDEDSEDEEIEEEGNKGQKGKIKDVVVLCTQSNTAGNKKKVSKADLLLERHGKAAEVSVARLLSDEDFRRIEAAQLKKQVSAVGRGIKRPAPDTNPTELVALGDIENIYKKRKHDKTERMKSVKKGQEGREKYGFKDGRLNPFSSKTNKEKNKTKNFMMVRHKVRGKIKRSFKDKQISLREHLIKQKKMK